MDRHMSAALDRYITGNYGEDQFRDELPEDAYHEPCEGEGCAGCNQTGIDPVKEAEYIAQAQADAESQYAAWAETEELES